MPAHQTVDANQGWLPLTVRKAPGCKRKVNNLQNVSEVFDITLRRVPGGMLLGKGHGIITFTNQRRRAASSFRTLPSSFLTDASSGNARRIVHLCTEPRGRHQICRLVA